MSQWHKLLSHVFICISLSTLFCQSNYATTSAVKLILIDTEGYPRYYYRNFILLAESVGFQVDYASFYDILENKQILNYDSVFFVASLALLKNIQSNLSQKCIKSLEDFSKQSNKLIGILSPAMPKYHPVAVKLMEALALKTDIISHNDPTTRFRRSVLSSFLNYIMQADSTKGALFGTTLLNKDMNTALQNTKNKTIKALDGKTGHVVMTTLPVCHNVAPTVQKTLPAGLYIKNNQNNNHYFVSKSSEFNFADIAENFWKSPLSLEQRNELLAVAQQILWELYSAYKNKAMPSTCTAVRPPLPEQLTLEFNIQKKAMFEEKINARLAHDERYAWIVNEGISCAWLEPDDYFLGADAPMHDELVKTEPAKVEYIKKQGAVRGADFIYNAGFNLLWFEFNPETFLSIHGHSKDRKEQFIKKITTIAQAIKNKFNKEDKPLPKVFIGTDITTNYGKHPVSCATQDVFGNIFSKIPCPLDFKGFWTPEVVDVFKLFVKTFDGVMPIDGIFLDFEMYHAQNQAGNYSELMDFSSCAWHIYCQTSGKHDAATLDTVTKRVDYLQRHTLFKDYFATLEHQARLLGQKIKDSVRAIKPDILFGAYAPTLPNSWFYRGILAGLSSADEPLIYATFNTDFYSHYDWLIQNDIYLLHGTPILLSKFQNSTDFKLIPELARFHYFIWYNRPSRMIYKKTDNRSWSVEASPLNAHTVATEIQKAHTQMRDNQKSTQ